MLTIYHLIENQINICNHRVFKCTGKNLVTNIVILIYNQFKFFLW